MLSAGAGKASFRNIMSHACRAGASGYLAGRAIWLDAFGHFPDWDRIRSDLVGEANDYMADLNALTEAEALPWHGHDRFRGDGLAFSPADASFRAGYREM